MLSLFVRQLHCAARQVRLVVLAGLVACCGRAVAAETADYWSICTDAAGLARQLAPVAARVEARVETEKVAVLISAVPQGEGSTEVFLASMADVFEQLRSTLQARKVSLQHVSFQWMSLSPGASPGDLARAPCRGAVLLLEVTSDQI